jgi:recombinational DNA repair ATPase RecF
MVYIAFLELYNKMKGEYPVFLVDDFDTAMDESNVRFLIESYPDLQVIATSVTKYSLFEGLFGLKKEC